MHGGDCSDTPFKDAKLGEHNHVSWSICSPTDMNGSSRGNNPRFTVGMAMAPGNRVREPEGFEWQARDTKIH